MNTTLAKKIIDFNAQLTFSGKLPDGYKILNPFVDNPETTEITKLFYYKFYNDNQQRKLILGINPSRNGAGVTGVPFTDTKRLQSECGITMQSAHTHEISSVFMYDMIDAFGGVKKFYSQFYINSPFPLAILHKAPNNDWLNANYYDDKMLFDKLKKFMITMLKLQIEIGLSTDEVFVLGKKNAAFIAQLNKEAKLFGKLTALEHPRYIQQYKSREKQIYIDKYIEILSNVNGEACYDKENIFS